MYKKVELSEDSSLVDFSVEINFHREFSEIDVVGGKYVIGNPFKLINPKSIKILKDKKNGIVTFKTIDRSGEFELELFQAYTGAGVLNYYKDSMFLELDSGFVSLIPYELCDADMLKRSKSERNHLEVNTDIDFKCKFLGDFITFGIVKLRIKN